MNREDGYKVVYEGGYGEKVVVRNAYYKSDEPWVTFRDIRDLFPKDSNDFREVAGTTSYGITHWKHI